MSSSKASDVSNEVTKIAIAVQKYYHPGQTFVNRHIRHLFDGNNCIITERLYEEPDDAHTRPYFYVGKEVLNAHDLPRLPYYLYQNNQNFHCLRVPFGEVRKRMREFLETQGANAILSEFGSQSMLVTDLGREMGLPVFCYFRGRDASYWLRNKKRVAAYAQVFENLSGIFAVSQFLLDNLASVGLTHPNAHVVPSGTDIEQFKPATKDPNLSIAVGRFVDKKYPQLTIRCFLDAARSNPNARLEMIGAGPALKECQEIVASEGAGARVILHGKKPSDFVAERLSEASIFVQHSVTDQSGEAEGLPSSIQEAMAAGCAILSTNHAGIPELVQPKITGLLSDELDEPTFTANFKTMLGDPDMVKSMGHEAREVAEEKIDYRKLYQKVERVISKSL